jgi:hypothetical protein
LILYHDDLEQPKFREFDGETRGVIRDVAGYIGNQRVRGRVVAETRHAKHAAAYG